ncbi:MAG: hypothetical protein M0027_07135 [Candidatus Dormibacteraeota bacterium]|jgi:hypothetical protein|nr:hypothetical protein [Candidatus Dormibacteraeota bacterium]
MSAAVVVVTDGSGPSAVDLGDGMVKVREWVEHWVVEVGWWRTPPQQRQSRDYWRVLLDDGRCLDLYRQSRGASWRLGRMWG